LSDADAGETKKSVDKAEDKAAEKRLERYRVTAGKGFALADHPTDDVYPRDLDEATAAALLRRRVDHLSDLQERLYRAHAGPILVVLQAMDAGGKDSTIKHVTSGINPQGIDITSFKAPSGEELAHDFLWRVSRALPARGMIGIFNRSHYEDVLIARVHPEMVDRPGLPPGAARKDGFWEKRLEDIAAFEHHLAREGTRIVKIFLHIGPDEQKKRLLARLDDPSKSWKFDPSDVKERALWPDYMRAYEAAIAATATKRAPWYVVPADRKWFARLVVAEAMVAAFDGIAMEPPDITPERRDAMGKARLTLLA
jgi:PPK2 family polyphosphate:nucleotide phosphotransferase